MSPASPRVRRSLLALAGAVAVVTVQVLAPVSSASATSAGDPATATPPRASVDVLRADASQVKAELAAIAGRRVAAEAKLALTRAAAGEATAALTTAKAAEAAAARRAEIINGRVRQAAVTAFIGTGNTIPLGVLLTKNADEASWQSTVAEYRADEMSKLLARQRDAQRALGTERAAREVKAEEAKQAQDRTQTEVDQLVDLENHQQQVVAQVNDRLDNALAEAAALAEIDRKAAAKLAKQEQALRDAVQAVAPAAPAPKTPATKGPSTPTTTTPPKSPTTTTPLPSPGTTVPVPQITAVDTVSVNGIVVARSISGQLAAMMAAAKSAGLTLGGSGYRDINAQIQLRISHCGSSDYAIWQMPASQCSPPTAIPGRSMHEKGLAIDFTCSRTLIGDHSDPCWVWLDDNAASFGFYNLPSEPWHWSTTGG